jgi:hypothetical protein
MKIDNFLVTLRPPVKMIGDVLSPIQPTQWGYRIDFDSIIGFSDPYLNGEYEDRHGPLLMGFTIKFKSDLPGVGGSSLNPHWEVPEEAVEVTWEEYASHHAHCRKEKPREGPHHIWKKFPEKFMPRLQEVVDYYVDLWEKIKLQGMKVGGK